MVSLIRKLEESLLTLFYKHRVTLFEEGNVLSLS